jgi:hypothetical protein
MSWLLHRSMSMKGIEENEADTELSMGTPTTGAVSLNSKPDTDICMYVYVYVCIYVRTYVHTYVWQNVNTCMYIYIYIYIYICTHTHTHTHTHTQYIYIYIYTHTHIICYINDAAPSACILRLRSRFNPQVRAVQIEQRRYPRKTSASLAMLRVVHCRKGLRILDERSV